MKKIFSSLLSLTMLFSLTTNSFVLAEEEPTPTEGTSENGGSLSLHYKKELMHFLQ